MPDIHFLCSATNKIVYINIVSTANSTPTALTSLISGYPPSLGTSQSYPAASLPAHRQTDRQTRTARDVTVHPASRRLFATGPAAATTAATSAATTFPFSPVSPAHPRLFSPPFNRGRQVLRDFWRHCLLIQTRVARVADRMVGLIKLRHCPDVTSLLRVGDRKVGVSWWNTF